MTTQTITTTGERADLLDSLTKQRFFLRFTVRDLPDDAARARPTASELCLGGLIRHVIWAEEGWSGFLLDGPAALGSGVDQNTAVSNFERSFRFGPDETLDGLLDAYEQATKRTDEIVASLPDLDATQPLPAAPWFEPGARWSARRVLLHLIGETSQHAGHADIIRESIDGAKSMG